MTCLDLLWAIVLAALLSAIALAVAGQRFTIG